MNLWRCQLIIAAILASEMWTPTWLISGMENTPSTWLLFHGSAAATSLAVMMLLPRFFSGKLLRDMMVLSFTCIVINAYGWAAYMLYLPPTMFNMAIRAVTLMQFLRLFFDGDANTIWDNLVRRRYFSGSKSTARKAAK